VIAIAAFAVVSCAPAAKPDAVAVGASAEAPVTPAAAAATTTTTAPTMSTTGISTTSTSTSMAVPSTAPPLAALRINDQPHGAADYRRDEWPTWKDIDGDGCDARDQALIAASNPPAQVAGRCDVASGTWASAYDDKVLTASNQVDVDHVVPLENAHESGGWQWSTDQRARYANDQNDLWVVSSSSNRSKGARGPDQWRPPSHAVWCTYATRWLSIKVRWDLSATTSERDALGQMLDTCPGAPGTVTSPPPTMVEIETTTTAATAPTTPATTSAAVTYANCAAARAAGVTPLHRGEPGYREGLDGDHDGIACE